MISKNRLIFFIGIMMLASSLFMAFANNVYIIGSFRWLWAPIILLSSVTIFNVLQSKQLIYGLFYGLFYAVVLQYSLWQYANDWYKSAILQDFYALIVVLVFYLVLVKNGNFKIWISLSILGLVFIFYTCLASLYVVSIDPIAVRNSYSYMEANNPLLKFGMGSYGFMTAIVALIPYMVFLVKKGNLYFYQKILTFFAILFVFYVLIKVQIFANILVGAGVLLFSALGAKRLNKSIAFLLITSVFLIAIPSSFYVNVLNAVADSVDHESLVHEKFRDMALYVDNPVLTEDDVSTEAGSRASRYPALWKAFIASPWFGDASYNSSYDNELATGGHLYWMSRLALWGIFGFLGYLFILRNIFKPVLRLFDNEFRFYYYLSLFSIIALGLLKNLDGREIYLMLFIIIPGLYFHRKPLNQQPT